MSRSRITVHPTNSRTRTSRFVQNSSLLKARKYGWMIMLAVGIGLVVLAGGIHSLLVTAPEGWRSVAMIAFGFGVVIVSAQFVTLRFAERRDALQICGSVWLGSLLVSQVFSYNAVGGGLGGAWNVVQIMLGKFFSDAAYSAAGALIAFVLMYAIWRGWLRQLLKQLLKW